MNRQILLDFKHLVQIMMDSTIKFNNHESKLYTTINTLNKDANK